MSVISVFIAQNLSPEARSKKLAIAAGRIIAKQKKVYEAQLGHKLSPPLVTVDGRKNAPLASVKPDGEIVASFNTLSDLIPWIMAELRKHSPVRTGRYENSHVLFLDGREVKEGEPIGDFDEAVILNVQPYARKIERGLSKQAAEGVYDVTALLAQRRFRGNAKIYFGWRSPLLSYVPGGANRAERAAQKKNRARTVAQSIERASRVPAIIIRLG